MLVLPESEGGVGGDMAAARFAALYPEGEVPSEDALREELVGSDTDADLDIITTDALLYDIVDAAPILTW